MILQRANETAIMSCLLLQMDEAAVKESEQSDIELDVDSDEDGDDVPLAKKKQKISRYLWPWVIPTDAQPAGCRV